jgi:hypothetical protein
MRYIKNKIHYFFENDEIIYLKNQWGVKQESHASRGACRHLAEG